MWKTPSLMTSSVDMTTMKSTNHQPLYPHHGAEYEAAMQSACDEYLAWMNQKPLGNGIHLYRRSPALDFSEIDVETAQVFE